MLSRLIQLEMIGVGVDDIFYKTKTSDFYSLVPSCPLPILSPVVSALLERKGGRKEQT